MKLGEVKPWEDPGFEEAHDPDLDRNDNELRKALDHFHLDDHGEELRRAIENAPCSDDDLDLVAILGEN